MPKARKKPRIDKSDTTVIDDPELARTEVIAKLAVARAELASAIESIDEAISYFIDPTGDQKGEKRAELIGGAEELIGDASIALDYAGERLDDADTGMGEPDDEETDEDEEDDEEDEDDEDEDEDDD